jgi:hypothetical protein
MQHLELAKCDLLTNKMDVELDMFGPPMVHGVLGEVNSRHVVAVDDCDLVDEDVKFAKKISEPATLCSRIGDRPVLCLCARTRDCGLALGRP